MWLSLLTLLVVTPVGWTYPKGAPVESCSHMTPQHGTSEQTTAPPYELVVDKISYAGGEEIEVTLRRTDSRAKFRGFFIQARTPGSSDAQGRFTGFDSKTKTVNCGGVANSQNAVTQTKEDERTSVTVTWTAPANRTGHIQFRATVVQKEKLFWVTSVKSTYVRDPTAGPLPVIATSDNGKSGCGANKGCYQNPTGCAPPSCEYFSSWQTSGNNILFEISGRSNGYVAIGFSEDNQMGLDDIYECVYDSAAGSTTVFSSWSTGQSRPQRDDSLDGISDIEGSYKDGVVSCKFTRAINGTVAGRQKRQAKINSGRFYDLNSAFYLLMAKGDTTGDIVENHGATRVVSSEKIRFQSNTQATGARSPDIVKAHGALMMIAWVCTCSVGILMARFFKKLWPEDTLCKEKVWFSIHRALMITTVLLTVIALILILAYNNWRWAAHAGAHAIIGIIVVILALINPLMALARPHPDQPKRIIFNWAHWGVGTAGRILGVVDIFLGMDLAALDLPPAATFILVGWVIWHALTEVVLEIHNCATTSNPGQTEEVEMENKAENNSSKPLRDNIWGLGIRKGVLGVYVVGMLGFLIALLVYVDIN